MKYNNAYNGEDFGKYLEYLNTIKERLPKDVFEFVSDPSRHDFSGQSLHDSWVKLLECSSNFETEDTNIVLTLINANFDREIRLSFQGVSQYSISQQMLDMYRDLITYEIGIEKDRNEDEKLIFRAMFSGDETKVEIYSDKIGISETIINQ